MDFSYGNVLLFGLALFLLAGVYSFVKQGLKIAAMVLLVLAGLAFAGGVMYL